LTRVEGGLALLLTGTLVWLAVPRVRALNEIRMRAEVPYMVDQLRQIAIERRRDGLPALDFGPWPRPETELNGQKVPWAGSIMDDVLLEPPFAQVRGTYTVESTAEGFRVVGLCDVDGDGVAAQYVATPSHNARAETEPHVF